MYCMRLTDSNTFIDLICNGCGVVFKRTIRDHKKTLIKGRAFSQCKPGCRPSRTLVPCFQCGTLTSNPRFCSKSCAAKTNNSLFPKVLKKKRIKICSVCEDEFEPLAGQRRTKCPACFERKKHHRIRFDARLGQVVKAKKSSKKIHPSWAFAQVRQLNRFWNAHLLMMPCANCGYALHVELAHIRGISTFKRSALLSEINGADNVIQLCRNCRWEFDHGFLELDGLPRVELGTPASVAGALSSKLQARSGAHTKKRRRSRKKVDGLSGLEPEPAL
jgi:hypothetical protein